MSVNQSVSIPCTSKDTNFQSDTKLSILSKYWVGHTVLQIAQNWLDQPISRHTPLERGESKLSSGVCHQFGIFFSQ